MKKALIAMLLICALCLPAAFAAEWADGLSAAQPYPGVPEVDLTQSMGYTMMFPWQSMPAERFCNVLEIYLPRTDVVLGTGKLTLCGAGGALAELAFDGDAVELRPLEEVELEGLMWGEGSCIEVHLPVSLAFDGDYYVLMDEGCFTAADGAVQSPAITAREAWKPAVAGDFGVSGVEYAEDGLSFDLVLGGDAASAVLYSLGDDLYFEQLEYSESQTVTGSLTGPVPEWGVVFLNADGAEVDVVTVK